MNTPTPNGQRFPPTSSLKDPVATSNSDPISKMTAPLEMRPPPPFSTDASCVTKPPILNGALDTITPPTTPEKTAEQRNSIDGEFEALVGQAGSVSENFRSVRKIRDIYKGQLRQALLDKVPEEPQSYNKTYKIDRELGQGAWSNVYRAYEQSQMINTSDLLPPSPPISPESKRQESRGKVLAVKIPSEKRAYQILKQEARILTYLHSHSQANSYLAPFHGFDISDHAIVMDAIPLSLEAFMKSDPNGRFSTKTMFDPVVGAKNWASLAKQLIDGLAFLQNRHCIHGDIKPANILIRSDEITDTVVPLYCDFSSARVQPPDGSGEPEEITAVTKDYLSPELLSALLGRHGERAIATFASDVFALAVTLIAVAIGGSPYACAHVEIQKLSMAKAGVPIDFARQGENGSRIMKGRAVEKILCPAVAKDPEKRITVDTWVRLTYKVLQRWDACGWSNGG